MPSPASSVISVDGGTVAIDRLGPGRPAPGSSGLVFIPGWCCPRQDWSPIARQLPDRPTLLMDLPGQGTSTSQRRHWTMADFGEATAEVVRAVGWDNVVLVGHSLGGAVAVEAAIALGPAAHQVICVDSLVYESYYAKQGEAFIEQELAGFAADFPGAMSALVRALFVDQTSPLIDQIAHTMASAPFEQALESQRTLLEWDRDEALPRCPAPIDVLAAAAFLDPTIPNRLSPNAMVTPVDLGGHFFLLEHPEQTAQAIERLLDARAGSPSSDSSSR